MSASYAQSLSQYQTDNILMNIVRAAEERPLSFLDIPSINGSGNINTSHSIGLSAGGLDAGNLYGSIVAATPNTSIGYGTTFTFTQSSLDNATFWKGVLAPITLKAAYNFRTSRIPKELLFTLIIDTIEIKDDSGEHLYINDPLDPSYEGFNHNFNQLLKAGLDIGIVEKTTPISTGNKTKNNSVDDNPATNQATVEYTLCLKQDSSTRSYAAEFNLETYCTNKGKTGSSVSNGKKRFVIKTRSPKSIFSYLGDVVTAQNSTPPVMVTLLPTNEAKNRKTGQSNQYALLVVNKNPPINMNAFASVSSIDGDDYAIPKLDNGYSPLVVDIIYQMLTLSKIAGSMPQQPAVIIK